MPSYQLKSQLPAYWVPYVPRQLTPDDPLDAQIYLRRARSVETADKNNPQYKTHIVKESWRFKRRRGHTYWPKGSTFMALCSW